MPTTADWELFATVFRMSSAADFAVGGVCRPDWPEGLLADQLSWPEPKYIPTQGDEWVGEYTCKGQHQLRIRITSAVPHSDLRSGGRLVYIFQGKLAFGYTAAKSQELPELSFGTIKGRYEPGPETVDFYHDGKEIVSDMAYFSGHLGVDGQTVAGVMPTCADGPFKLQKARSTRGKPTPWLRTGVPPIGCSDPACVAECGGEKQPPTLPCLNVLWTMAGCDLDAEYAPAHAPEKQRRHWLQQTTVDALDDMRWYATYARMRKDRYPNWCLSKAKVPTSINLGGSLRRTHQARLNANLKLDSLLAQLVLDPLPTITDSVAVTIYKSIEMYRGLLMPTQRQDKARTTILRSNVEKVYTNSAHQHRHAVFQPGSIDARFLSILDITAQIIKAKMEHDYVLAALDAAQPTNEASQGDADDAAERLDAKTKYEATMAEIKTTAASVLGTLPVVD
jgi:hypothetical protein